MLTGVLTVQDDRGVQYVFEMSFDDVAAMERFTEDGVHAGVQSKSLLRNIDEIKAQGKLAVGPFVYDLDTHRLYRDGEELTTAIPARMRNMMLHFMKHHGRTVLLDDLKRLFWEGPTRFTSDDTVRNSVAALRKHLRGSNPSTQDEPTNKYIKLVPGFGYIFEVTEE